ncbi:MAG: substrate-binding domain-containing protein [Ruminococcus sp.]|nr:substrate-binding domain-containing protein [Ruminococcus sp.]
MKKTVRGIAAVMAIFTAVGATSCGSDSGTINVISREDGSGTRSAFVEIVGIEEKDSDGNSVDNTTVDAMICKSTDVMLTQVAGDEDSIGYVSYGSLNDTVKALKIDGVEVNADTIKDGSYPIVRPFNIITGDSVSEAAEDFISYIMSKEGQQIIEDEKYVAVDESAAAYEASSASGKVVVAGSSSVGPVMQKLAEEYQKVNESITVEVQVSDSTTGVKYTQEGTCDIGMISRDLKDEETGLTQTTIAQDAIAAIVNTENEIDDIATYMLKSIYVGDVTEWSDVTGE